MGAGRDAQRALTALLVVVVMAGAACTNDDGDEQETSPTPTAIETRTVVYDPSADLTWVEGTVTRAKEPELLVGAGTAVLAFPRPEVPARCFQAAQLRIALGTIGLATERDLSVYPSTIFHAVELEDGDEVAPDGALLDIRPTGRAEYVRDEVHFDVLDIYKLWLRGGPFPSLSMEVPRSSDIVLAIRRTSGEGRRFRIGLMSSESSTPPQVVAEIEKGCG